ncbi:MAG: leucine-rich repeat protein [Treponema sp.]|nr:leucine-rich repeat protein [Treponema sp.]
MKKLIAILSALVLLGAAAFARPAKSKGAKAAADGAAPADKGKVSIAVPAPKAVNLGEGADWIPLFVQGVITANFQQYSGLAVIDRQNADMVKAEQRLSESAEFDEKNTLELGKLTNAHLTVTGNIMAKSGAYALTFNITDVETGETKASASVPDCPRSALEDGTAANRISYDLMAGYGIALGDDAKARLTQTASVMTSETSAQASVAKGIAAAKGGSNIEALTYYIRARASDSRLSEAASRMAGMTTVVAGGNFGATAKNMMKLHDDWDQLLLEAARLMVANPPVFELHYFTDIEPLALTAKDYENETMSFRIGAPYLIQTSGAENFKMAGELMAAMRRIPGSENWGKKMNGFPWTYAGDIPGDHWLKWASEDDYEVYEDQRYLFGATQTRPNPRRTKEYQFTIVLLDANKNRIASRPYTLYAKFDRAYLVFEIYSDNKDNYNDSLPSLKISGVPVGNADTDKIYISVEGAEKAGFSVLPTDALPVDKAISVLEAGSHNGTVKIGGFFQPNSVRDIASAIKSNKKPVALDLSEHANVSTIESKSTSYFGYKGGWFKGLTPLAGITLPVGLEIIADNAFSDCTSLKSVTIPAGVWGIGDSAFRNCTSLESVTIPASVWGIGGSAFRNCTSLKSITLPANAMVIGKSAFARCTSLASIEIHASVIRIDEDAFYDCKLKTVYYAGSKEQWDKIALSGGGSYKLVSAKKEYNYKPQETDSPADSSSDGKGKKKK